MARLPTPLPDNVRGWGPVINTNDRSYRQYLMRDWRQPGENLRTVLWIGMNPSTANATHEDLTCKIERRVSQNLGFNRYFKANILDIMETNSRMLAGYGNHARSNDNIPRIHSMARRADSIILSHGDLPEMFRNHLEQTYAAIQEYNIPIRYFALNTSQNPAHTLRSSRLGLLGNNPILHDFVFHQ